LRNYCRRVAVRKCGKGDANKACRIRVRKEIRKREKTFRRTSLKACACKAKLSEKCRARLATSRRCARKYNRCARRCLRRACKSRARTSCVGKQGEIKCRRVRARRCRRLHCSRRVRRQRKQHKKQTHHEVKIHHQVQVQHHAIEHETKKQKLKKKVKNQLKALKTLPDDVLTNYCKQKAREKCGFGKENQRCRIRVREEIKNQEIVFRLSAISHCKCDATSPLFVGHSCSSIVNSCAKTCVERACKIRSSLECQSNKDQITCFNESHKTCTDLHVLKN